MFILLDRYVLRLTRISFAIGTAMFPILMLVIMFNVIMRYMFSFGSIELEEFQWHIYAIGFLFCLPMLIREDGNVRIDIIYEKLSSGAKKYFDIFGYSILALPFVLIICWFSYKYFWTAWILNESSEFPSGLPARYIIKFALFYAFVNLSLEILVKITSLIKGQKT
ncbi:MAG: TRAP transporter small permease subunit [Rhizobiaceae bacterium]|nr:TRAP transporter small permease subunit [Rhizobiaceae bacterium]